MARFSLRPPAKPSSKGAKSVKVQGIRNAEVLHSSPKSGSGHISSLHMDDSVASAVLRPFRIQRSSSVCSLPSETGVRRQRNQQLQFSTRQDDGDVDEKSVRLAWTEVCAQLVSVFEQRNKQYRIELKELMDNCTSKRTEFRKLQLAEKRWTRWLQQTKALEDENQLLESLIRTLGGCSPDSGDVGHVHEDPGLLNNLHKFIHSQLNTSCLTKLPLDYSDHISPIELPEFIPNIRQFASTASGELCNLEALADMLEELADRLERRDVSICREKFEMLITDAQEFAHAASLHVEKIQKHCLEQLSSH